MNILIAIHDLTNDNCHLMPWRIVCEVTKRLNKRGHKTTLVSLSSRYGPLYGERLPGNSVEVRKTLKFLCHDLKRVILGSSPDVIFWPVSWRESRRRHKVVRTLGLPAIGYFPGGCYSLRSGILSIRRIGLRAALPYLIESIAPKTRQLKSLKANGFEHLITMTSMTMEKIVSSGWSQQNIHSILPGKDAIPLGNPPNLPLTFQEWNRDRTFFLFMGPPYSIRGVYELLKAFDIAAEHISDTTLVCLFRSDGNNHTADIRSQILKLRHRDRVFVCWESLEKETLNAYISQCHSVVMPFILVPSEIPLAIIETIGWGKPIITTECGGTEDFVLPFGVTVPPGDIDELAQALVDFAGKDRGYDEKCKNAMGTFMSHPTWEEVAMSWLDVAESVIH